MTRRLTRAGWEPPGEEGRGAARGGRRPSPPAGRRTGAPALAAPATVPDHNAQWNIQDDKAAIKILSFKVYFYIISQISGNLKVENSFHGIKQTSRYMRPST